MDCELVHPLSETDATLPSPQLRTPCQLGFCAETDQDHAAFLFLDVSLPTASSFSLGGRSVRHCYRSSVELLAHVELSCL